MVMAMKDRLARDLSDIDADIEAFNGWVPSQNLLALGANQPLDGRSFPLAEIEERCDVAPGQDQSVERRRGAKVPHSERKLILGDDFRRIEAAKNAAIAFVCIAHAALLAQGPLGDVSIQTGNRVSLNSPPGKNQGVSKLMERGRLERFSTTLNRHCEKRSDEALQ
jgi:hypothetical protein